MKIKGIDLTHYQHKEGWGKRTPTTGCVSFRSVQSVSQSCPALCNPMDCSTPGFSVHHQFLELAHTHAHQIHDAIQPSHPLSSRSLPGFNLSQHQGLFKWVSSSHQVTNILEFSFNISPSNEYLGLICGKFWKRWEYQTAWPAAWQIYMQVRKQQLELDMVQQTGSK